MSDPAQYELEYTLAKQVPDMARGFTIQTCYGDIVVLPGDLADSVQRLVRNELSRQHLTLVVGAAA